jgi:hypothetical protein
MQYVPCDVSTVCMGLAASMGQFLLCSGAPGKRYALPHSRILMHQPSGQMQGQATDIAIQAEQIVYLKRMMAERIAFHTGQTIERIERDSDRDRWFTADEAKDYGFIDQVISTGRSCRRARSRLALSLRPPAQRPERTSPYGGYGGLGPKRPACRSLCLGFMVFPAAGLDVFITCLALVCHRVDMVVLEPEAAPAVGTLCSCESRHGAKVQSGA